MQSLRKPERATFEVIAKRFKATWEEGRGSVAGIAVRVCPACGAASLSRWALCFASRKRGTRCPNCGARIALQSNFLRVLFEHLLLDTVFIVLLIVGINAGAGILVSLLLALATYLWMGFYVSTSGSLKKIAGPGEAGVN